jgi:dihydroorotate dehydrogenase (fumarate)
MGLQLKNPIIVSSSELTGTFSNIRRCIDSGAGAIVLKSIFEEQILESLDLQLDRDDMYFWYPEAAQYVRDFSLESGIEDFIKLIKTTKDYSDVPLIASINCVSSQEWPDFAVHLQEAGVDGLELNIAIFPKDETVSVETIEKTYVDIVQSVKKRIKLPVSVKLSPFFTNHLGITHKLVEAKADALVLFNRFYRPDLDIDAFKVIATNVFSAPEELTMSLRWIMLLSNKLKCDLAAGTGIHDYTGVVKQILAGASSVQICSTLYKNGIEYLSKILHDLEYWMRMKECLSLQQFKGMMADSEEVTAAFERIQFMKKTTGDIISY